jgi:hypothetical protein
MIVSDKKIKLKFLNFFIFQEFLNVEELMKIPFGQ